MFNKSSVLNKDCTTTMELYGSRRGARSKGRNAKVRTYQTESINKHLNNNFQNVFFIINNLYK